MAPKAKTDASKPSVSIEDLFTSINRHIEGSQYAQVVKAANQVLSITPGDEDAIRCKIVALIKDDKIEEALRIIQSTQRLSIDVDFFKAYCFYRQNKLDEALKSLRSQEGNVGAMLLKSQILYRLGRMDECLEIYHALEKSKIDSLEINYVAGLVSAGRSSEVQTVMDALRVKATSSFELAYNTACALIDGNSYADAEQLLLSARRLGQETLMDENWADEDIEIELAPIAVQLAYVRQLLGHRQEAMEGYSDIIKRNLADDESSRAVAVNNFIVLKGPKDVNDGLKKLDRLMEKGDGGRFLLAPGVELKLSAKQKEAIFTNRVLLLLHANRVDQAQELVAGLQGKFPDSVTPVLLQAAVFVRENKPVKAEEVLTEAAKRLPEKSKLFLLARAQVAAAAGRLQAAAESLAIIPDIQHMPATVATIVALKERAGDIDGAETVFDAAIKYWTNAMTEDSKLSIIMQEAAAFKLKHGREKQAFHLFEELVKTNGSVDALVGLVTTAAYVNVEKAEAYEKQLKPLPILSAKEVEVLERTSGAKPTDTTRTARLEAREENKSKEKTKKKRKRKPRYPKGFDPANPGPPPDPERWLPKRERSSYRPKRKDKRAVRGSQGAVVREKHEVATSDTSRTSTGADASTSSSKQATSSKGATQNAGSSKSRKKSRK